jgi:hypothetical protein
MTLAFLTKFPDFIRNLEKSDIESFPNAAAMPSAKAACWCEMRRNRLAGTARGPLATGAPASKASFVPNLDQVQTAGRCS